MSAYLPPLQPPMSVIATGTAALTLLCVASIIGVRTAHPRVQDICDKLIEFSFFGIVLALAGLAFTSGPTFLDFYLPALFNSPWAAFAVLALGLALFLVRKWARALYAAIEIVGALLTTIAVSITHYGTTYQRGSALLTAMYFLIRGLDNADQGGLLGKVRDYVTRPRPLFAYAIPPMIILGAVANYYGRRDLTPPYIIFLKGGGAPVSAMKCGDLWIVCDEAAWKLHDRLVSGTDKDRLAEQQQADGRARTYLAKHGFVPQ